MHGKGRLQFKRSDTPQVLAIVYFCRSKGRRRVEVYIHQKYGKMYTWFDRAQFFHSPDCWKYLDALGMDKLVIELEDTND